MLPITLSFRMNFLYSCSLPSYLPRPNSFNLAHIHCLNIKVFYQTICMGIWLPNTHREGAASAEPRSGATPAARANAGGRPRWAGRMGKLGWSARILWPFVVSRACPLLSTLTMEMDAKAPRAKGRSNDSQSQSNKKRNQDTRRGNTALDKHTRIDAEGGLLCLSLVHEVVWYPLEGTFYKSRAFEQNRRSTKHIPFRL